MAEAPACRPQPLKLDDGTYRLVVQSTTTGAASTVTLTATDGSDLLGGAAVVAGRDAAITIGGGHAALGDEHLQGRPARPRHHRLRRRRREHRRVDGRPRHRGGRHPGQGLRRRRQLDPDRHRDQTKYNATTKTSGALAGDASVRDLSSALLDAINPGDGTTLADIGIQTDRYGKLVFNEEKFAEAYAADAAAVTAKLSGATGLAARIEEVATGASDKYEGSITTSITGRTTGIDRLNDSIEAWDERLELRRRTLTRQFTALETALSQMNSQSSWLTSQIGMPVQLIGKLRKAPT